ncbi:MAG: hypothetical protein H0U13_10470 [Gemmatimonadaceae bacterium]|nr:hypothetical protein [Gemmatimonadaceae bacterium]
MVPAPRLSFEGRVLAGHVNDIVDALVRDAGMIHCADTDPTGHVPDLLPASIEIGSSLAGGGYPE